MKPHDEGVILCTHWLRSRGHWPVFAEPRGAITGEVPDAIGWTERGLECDIVDWKCTREDFKADRCKPTRTCPDTGLGSSRWYACEPGVILKNDDLRGWGLLWDINGGLTPLVYPSIRFRRNMLAEFAILHHAFGLEFRRAAGSTAASADRQWKLDREALRKIEEIVPGYPQGISARELAQEIGWTDSTAKFAMRLKKAIDAGHLEVGATGPPMVVYPLETPDAGSEVTE